MRLDSAVQREMISEDVIGGNCMYLYSIWMDIVDKWNGARCKCERL